MSLRDLAAQDLAAIMQDKVTGFGWDIVLSTPLGVKLPFVGFSTDIAQAVDPETGTLISGRLASVAVPMTALYAAGLTDLPRALPDSNARPWLVSFADVDGLPYKFKVAETRPDRAIGSLVMLLETYRT